MVAAFLCGVMAQNNAINIYRTDGDVITFLKANIDSIRWSHIGIDSILYKDYVIQEIWTSDSVYRIPLADIDSISLKRYTCPDGNHPHVIDLGLPSGTKWCCCNVGASSPKDSGGYYAWGEIAEKNYYGADNYEHYDKEQYDIIYIGQNISGTQYDVAHVRMGAPWRMPTHEQQKELIECCTWVMSQQNGVNGYIAIGPSGGQIFLPVTGCRCFDHFDFEDSDAFYWAGSLTNNGGYDYASNLYFRFGYWLWYGDYYRPFGLPVRAVCP